MNAKLLRTALLMTTLLACGSSWAQGPYVEVRAGLAQVGSLSGGGPVPVQFTESVAGTDVRATLDHGMPIVVGVESGIRRIADTPFTASVSLDTLRMELDSATLDDGSVGRELSAEEVADAGVDFDQRVMLIGVNGYYELEREEKKYFGGVGLGGALVGNADAELGLLVHAGFRYETEMLGYLNARITWFRGGASRHNATGLQFEKMQFIMATLAFGLDL